MRIGLVIYGKLETVTGGFIYDRKMVAYLKEAGDEVHILSLPWRSTVNHLLYNLSSSFIKRVSALRLDILLEDELNHASCLALNRHMKREKQCHIISIVHHLRMNEERIGFEFFNDSVERAYLRSVDGFIFNSQTTAASVIRLADHKPAIVAYPGKDRYEPSISKSEVAKRSRQKGALGIVFLGNVTPRKGLKTLIHALQPLPHAQWRLTVIGSRVQNRTHSNEIMKQVHASRMNDNITFTGEKNPTEVAKHLRHNHLLAVPSYYEGFGLAYVEGMGFGLPAIGTNTGGAREIIKHDVNGFLIPPNDVAALTSHIRLLISNRRRLERMSVSALQNYQGFPGWHDTTRKIRDFLCATMSTRQK